MLRDDDIVRFRDHFRVAAAGGQAPCDPTDALRVTKGLSPEEIARLAQSLQIAAVLGDADAREAQAASLIARRVASIYCVGFDQAAAWYSALAWALAQPEMDAPHTFSDRAVQVGRACQRLRKRGYHLSVQSHGVDVAAQAERDIAQRIDGLVAHLGGAETMLQVCRVVADMKLTHDGMWLLGDRVPGIWSAKRPALPIGWLFSCGVRHLGLHPKVRKPAVIWGTISQLAMDYAAAINCQRYNQYEHTNIRPGEIWFALRDSLLWRELFGLPQVPQQVISGLREAISALTTAQDESGIMEHLPQAPT